MRSIKLSVVIGGVALFLAPLSVGAISSTTYQMDPETVGASSASVTSTTYSMDAIVDTTGGRETSTSYVLEAGGSASYYCGDGFRDPVETCDRTDLNSSTCVTEGFVSGSLTCSSSCAFVTSACSAAAAVVSGGGGGGPPPVVGKPPVPTVDPSLAVQLFTYAPSLLLFGTMDATINNLIINTSTLGITYPTTTSWKKTASLAFSANTFSIAAVDAGVTSDVVAYQVYRRLIGDVNQDNTVNDYDLSKFLKSWGGSSRAGDFNEDGKVNDYDFSMMVARWGTRV